MSVSAFGANAARAEAMPNAVEPISRRRLRPIRSARLLYHFASKQELLLAMAHDWLERFRADVLRWQEELERLRERLLALTVVGD